MSIGGLDAAGNSELGIVTVNPHGRDGAQDTSEIT